MNKKVIGNWPGIGTGKGTRPTPLHRPQAGSLDALQRAMEKASEPPSCAECAFISYRRTAVVQGALHTSEVTEIRCMNPDLAQQFVSEALYEVPFAPPRLTFGCNRFLQRAPDLGFRPEQYRSEP